MRLGRIAGVAVEASWTVVLIIGFLAWSLAASALPEMVPNQAAAAYWAAGVLAALGLMASILAHELGHALVANHLGVHVEEVTLWVFGGVARFSERARDATSELEIALAGPAVSAAVGAACLAGAGSTAAFGAPRLLTASLAWIGVLNIVLLAFNLLPGAPLDGGRVLAAVLWRRSGDEMSARKRAARAGQVLGRVLVALGVVQLLVGLGVGGIWLALIGWYLMSTARAEEAYIELLVTFEGVHVRDVMSTDVRSVHGGCRAADFVDRVAREATARPDELLVDVLGRARAGSGPVFVVEERRLVGIVTSDDVAAAAERLALTHPHDGPSTPAPRQSAVGGTFGHSDRAPPALD
jgi:Zn-dependent protease